MRLALPLLEALLVAVPLVGVFPLLPQVEAAVLLPLCPCPAAVEA